MKQQVLSTATLVATMLAGLVCCAARGPSTSPEPLCASGGEPRVAIDTARGPIVVRLFEGAAPRAVRRLVRLLEGPVFHPDLFAEQEAPAAVGYYDGLAFSHTQPHVEIATGVRPPGDLIRIETELDAVALGLDREKIRSAAEAMDLAQRELAPAYKRALKAGGVSDRLKGWMEKLYATHDAAFLTGVSRQEINEALGYSYQEGLDSRPVKRGALMLKPLSPRQASARLSIALADMPQRTGRWMVLGQVVAGLETAEEISVEPLADPALVRGDRHRPLSPVTIEAIRFECRPIP